MRPRRPTSQLMVVMFLGILSATTGGCGLFLTHAPPEGHEQMDYFTCTENDLGPIFDAAYAVMGVVLVVAAASEEEAGGDWTAPPKGAGIAMGATTAVLYGSSAIVGSNKTKKCRAAIRHLRERQAQHAVTRPEEQIDILVQSVVLTPSADTLAVGEQLQLTADAYNSGGAVIPNRMFAWSSSTDAIASVSNAGLVVANAIGEVVVAARTDNVVGTATIVVVSRR